MQSEQSRVFLSVHNLVGLISCAVVTAMLAGCAVRPKSLSYMPRSASVDDQSPEPLTGSLFPSDQSVISDTAVERILSSKLQLPSKPNVAMLRFSAGRTYSRDEDQIKLQQSQVDVIVEALRSSRQVDNVKPLPSLMTPARTSISLLRESALRMQADLLLVFRVGAETYSQYRIWGKDKAKAFSTCEIVLLDVRTGLVPFTDVVSRENMAVKQPKELDLSETMRRAEQAAATEALQAAAEDLVKYLQNAPRKSD